MSTDSLSISTVLPASIPQIQNSDPKRSLFKSINTPHRQDSTPLSKIKTLFQQAGGNPNMVRHKQPILHLACWKGRRDIVQFLMKQGADPTKRDSRQQTALHHAAFIGDLKIVKQVFRHKILNALDIDGDTPLHVACVLNRSSTIEYLISCKRIKLNKTDRVGRTPLDLAFYSRNEQNMILLIQAGTSITETRFAKEEFPCLSEGLDPPQELVLTDFFKLLCDKHLLQVAAFLLKENEHVEPLFKHAKSLSSSKLNSIIYALSQRGSFGALKKILTIENVSIKEQPFLLIEAMGENHGDTAALLVEHGARTFLSINLDEALNEDGWTLLHFAAFHNFVHATRRLLKAGASANVLTQDFRSPRDIAKKNGNQEIVKIIPKHRRARYS